MKRLYYIANDLETTKRVADALHQAGVTNWNFHVIAKDEAGLYQHHIHSATTYQELDVVHTGMRWALVGVAIGLAIALGGIAVELLPRHWIVVSALPFVFACFGAWQGGMIGLSRESYKIAPFHHLIAQGKYLMLVDVKGEMESKVRKLLNLNFHELREGGTDSTFINPFKRPTVVHHQTTH